MTERKRTTIGINLLLTVLALFIGVVCFYPATVAVSGTESVYTCGNRQGKGVSLLVNVYWGTDEVYAMLDTLDEYAAKATFFIGGCWADDNVECLKAIVSRGHEIGSHGYFHKDCTTLTSEELKEEINLSRRFFLTAAGVDISLFAPPSGAYDDKTVELCRSLGLKVVLWSKDTVDWRDKDAKTTYTRATEGVSGGEFILMHPMPSTAQALPDILEYYRKAGLTATTVSQNLTYGG